MKEYDQHIKQDGDKYKPHLVPMKIIEAIALVREFGIKKYKDEDSWRKVEKIRYVDALLRHIIAYQRGENIDSESGLPHLHHAACNLAFLIERSDES